MHAINLFLEVQPEVFPEVSKLLSCACESRSNWQIAKQNITPLVFSSDTRVCGRFQPYRGSWDAKSRPAPSNSGIYNISPLNYWYLCIYLVLIGLKKDPYLWTGSLTREYADCGVSLTSLHVVSSRYHLTCSREPAIEFEIANISLKRWDDLSGCAADRYFSTLKVPSAEISRQDYYAKWFHGKVWIKTNSCRQGQISSIGELNWEKIFKIVTGWVSLPSWYCIKKWVGSLLRFPNLPRKYTHLVLHDESQEKITKN